MILLGMVLEYGICQPLVMEWGKGTTLVGDMGSIQMMSWPTPFWFDSNYQYREPSAGTDNISIVV